MKNMEIKMKFKPNPEYRLMNQVREILRYYHYAYRTEQPYSSWILQYIKFYGGKNRTVPRTRSCRTGAKPDVIFFPALLYQTHSSQTITDQPAFLAELTILSKIDINCLVMIGLW